MSSPSPEARPASRPSTVERAAFFATLVLLAVTLVMAARSPGVVEEARIGRRVELVELIQLEQQRTLALQGRVEELAARLAVFEEDPPGDPELVHALQERIAEVAGPAGMTAVHGPGLAVVLTDSSLSTSPTGDLNDLVIHEQDLQAVINALWAGGAEAMTVNGQRVLATTAIRCVGNTLLLHGAVYSPPYRINAIGDVEELRQALDRDPAVQRFEEAVSDYQLGFSVSDQSDLVLPAYEGVPAFRIARPAGT